MSWKLFGDDHRPPATILDELRAGVLHDRSAVEEGVPSFCLLGDAAQDLKIWALPTHFAVTLRRMITYRGGDFAEAWRMFLKLANLIDPGPGPYHDYRQRLEDEGVV
jgi:hypothetical protein